MSDPADIGELELFGWQERKAALREGGGWEAKAPTRRDALRALLSDGLWHTQQELERAGGMRFGGRIHELRKAGFRVEKRMVDGDSSRWVYRAVSGPLLVEVGA